MSSPSFLPVDLAHIIRQGVQGQVNPTFLQATAGTPQSLIAVQTRQDPPTRISSAERNLRLLAERYFNHPSSFITNVHVERSTAGRLQVIMALEMDDIDLPPNSTDSLRDHSRLEEDRRHRQLAQRQPSRPGLTTPHAATQSPRDTHCLTRNQTTPSDILLPHISPVSLQVHPRTEEAEDIGSLHRGDSQYPDRQQPTPWRHDRPATLDA